MLRTVQQVRQEKFLLCRWRIHEEGKKGRVRGNLHSGGYLRSRIARFGWISWTHDLSTTFVALSIRRKRRREQVGGPENASAESGDSES